MGFLSVSLGGLVGVTLGVISGYYGGVIDSIIMRVCDVLLAFPGILLAIGVIAILGPGIENVIYAVAVFSVPIFARLARGSTLSLKRAVYVDAARAIGVKDRIIMMRHLPGALPNVIVYFSMRIGTSILTAASLSFIGLGAQPPSPEWAPCWQTAQLYRRRRQCDPVPRHRHLPHRARLQPSGDGLRDALDPKLKMA